MDRKLIIFDFEVFKHDTLLGADVIEPDGSIHRLQTWDLDEIREFYNDNKESIWVGWNVRGYDAQILEAIVYGKDPFVRSKEIINEGKRYTWLKMQLYYWDIMDVHHGSLKVLECSDGKSIEETEVDFNLDRQLTQEEKTLTETYNGCDLDQTRDAFFATRNELQLRLNMLSEFKMPMSCLNITGAQLAAKILNAKRIPGIENAYIKPPIYENLKIKNQEVWDFYLSEGFRQKKSINIMLCGLMHKVAAGGIHAAQEKVHVPWAYYVDVNGMYNRIMIEYNLLPRSMSKEGKDKYIYMFEEQNAMKKNPDPAVQAVRWVYKTALLSVFGAQGFEYSDFYDPYQATLVTITGELFAIDLLEKLDGKVELIQSNTDGYIFVPLEGVTDEDIQSIMTEWEQRTKLKLKKEIVYDIQQRDVNNYMYRTADGDIHTLGEALKYYNHWENSLDKDVFTCNEPPIFHHILVEYYMNHKMPEQVVEENKRHLRMFHYVCKKGSYDGLEYQQNFNDGTVEKTQLQKVNRAFPMNDPNSNGMVYKYKNAVAGTIKVGKQLKSTGKATRAKVANLPDSVFIYDKEILSDEAYDYLKERIDWQYYVDRGYEKILTYTQLIQIKDFNIKEKTV